MLVLENLVSHSVCPSAAYSVILAAITISMVVGLLTAESVEIIMRSG